MIALEQFFALLPPERLEQFACRYQLDTKHSVSLSGPVVFLCLLNGLLYHPELSLRLLEETYHQQTGRTIDHSSFGKCLARINSAFFADLFAALYQQSAGHASPAEQKALRLRFVDATIVTLSAKLLAFGLWAGTCNPDKARRQVKTVLELNGDRLPRLLHVCTEPSENADSVALGETMRLHSQPGDLWVFDKGCHGRERLRAIAQAGAFFLTPHSQQKLRRERLLFEADPTTRPTTAPQKGEPTFVLVRVEQAVFANSKSSTQWEDLPLVVLQGLRWDTRKKLWQPMALLTNLPVSEDGRHLGPYTFVEVCALYRQRWDIEVFFKFVKQRLNYDHLTSRCENGIRVMLYMSLITALLLIWYKRQTQIDRGWRSVKFWLADDVRQWTQQVLQATYLVPDG